MRARAALAALCFIVAAVGGCRKHRTGVPTADEAAPGASAPSGPPYRGPLTVDRMEQAKTRAAPHQKWDAALAALRATVGEPTRIDGDVHGWYLLDGAKCHFLEVTRDSTANEVSSSQHGAVDKDVGSYFAKCSPTLGAGSAAGAAETATGQGASDDQGDSGAVEPGKAEKKKQQAAPPAGGKKAAPPADEKTQGGR